MALGKRKLLTDPTTGFGVNSDLSGNRFFRRDGRANVVRRGISFFDQFSWYHTMISMSGWKFWPFLCFIYFIINLLFAWLYFLIGVEHLGGANTGSTLKDFAEAFFFSTQTFTTVGYGRISPTGFWTNAVASFEALVGLLAFAFTSGLFFGRFAKPRAYLQFSDMALLSPYKNGKALMFRTSSYINNHLMDAEVKLTLAMRVNKGGIEKNEFYPLKVEFDRITSLVLNWTIVHPIDEHSPLYGLTVEDMKAANAELLVALKAYDEIFVNNVVARTSYTAQEIVNNARFKPMYRSSQNGHTTILDVDKINDYELLA